MNIYFDNNSIESIDAAIEKYRPGEFASPTRSTVPLLSFLKHEQSMLRELLEDLCVPPTGTLHLEYTVTPPSGRGRPSHTDLLVRSADTALAIEAKWTEPRYATVGKWLLKGSNLENRKHVLAGWLGLLQKQTRRTLRVEDFTDAVYQMVHRAASACEAGDHPEMAYLVFKLSPGPRAANTQQIQADLEHLWRLLDGPSFPFYLIEVSMAPTTAFEAIAGLPKRAEDTKRQVCAALGGSQRLFRFEKYSVTRVGETP